MSTIKKKLQQAASGYDAGLQSDQESNDGGSDTEMAPKYMLRVSAGPSYDPSTHRLLVVNSSDALSFENEFVRVKVKVRIRDYVGLPKDSPKHTPYFDDPIHKHDQYSVAFSFVPKVDLPSTDTVWGNDFDHPVRDRLPPGFNTAFKIVKEFIDPGLSCDAYADQPWLYGPALSCWFAFRIGEKVPETDNIQQPDEEQVMTDGADGSGADIRKELDLPEAGDKRRKFFLSQENREQLVFEKGRLYQGDFFNPYLDFNKFALRLPGFSLSVIRYINDKTHHMRYVFKNVKTGDVYFVVVFTLLFGDQLKKALATEQDRPTSIEKDAN